MRKYLCYIAVVFASLPSGASAFSPSLLAAKKTSFTVLQAENNKEHEPSRRTIISSAFVGSLVTLGGLGASPRDASARLESVNRPDLLPSEKGLNVIQVEKFLTSGQAKRMNEILSNLEKDTGYRVRVLCQRYPNTPGLAIRDYWDLGKEVKETNTNLDEIWLKNAEVKLTGC